MSIANHLSWQDFNEAVAELAGMHNCTPARMHEEVVALSASDDLDDLAAALVTLATGRQHVASPGGTFEPYQPGDLALSGGYDAGELELASDLSDAERSDLADKGQALPDGSYPVPDVEHLKAAAILCKSHHGDWQAAAKLIARRARELRVPNPLDEGGSMAATGYQAGTLALAGEMPADAQVVIGDVFARHPELFDPIKVMKAGASGYAEPVMPAVQASGQLSDADVLGLTGPEAGMEILRLTSDPRSRAYFAASNDDGDQDDGSTADEIAGRHPEFFQHQVTDSDPTDRRQPARGGRPHDAEVERLTAMHTEMVGDNGNRTHRPLTPAERARRRKAARPGHTGG